MQNFDPQEIIGNEEAVARIRSNNPELSEKMIRVLASGWGPIISDTPPPWPHGSLSPLIPTDLPNNGWIMELTKDGKVCWI